jgi:predicted O-methyltransferase YrrM
MLPVTSQFEFNVTPIAWLGLHREYQNAGELEILVALARSIQACTMLEIGCRDGRTARLMLHNVLSLTHYLGIEVGENYEPQHDYQCAEMPQWPGEHAVADPRFDLVIRARGSLDLTAAELPAFDIAYIDGDHGDRAVRHDSMLALEVVRPGGLIVWHDYNNATTVDVKKIIDELAEFGFPIKLIERTWFAYMCKGGSDADQAATQG